MKLIPLVAVGSDARVEAWLCWWLGLRVNAGAVAGEAIAHPHVQLIPGYACESVEPFSGVRGVIPKRQKY